MDNVIKTLKSQRASLLAEVSRIDGALAALGGDVSARKTAKKATRKQRRKLTAAERQAISDRMKKSWAARKRKAKQAKG